MFDFIVHISSESSVFRHAESYEPRNYLENIDYQEDSINGNQFCMSLMYHKGRDSGHFTQDSIHIFRLGHVFANNKHPEREKFQGRELRSEELLQLYLKHGDQFIQYVKGLFIILVFDEKAGAYMTFQSISGLYDVYYYKLADSLLISTSPDRILATTGVSRKVDNVAVLQHLVFDYPLGDRTLFEELEILPPQHKLSFDLHSLKKERFFDYLDLLGKDNTLSWKETLEQIPAIFNDTLDTISSTDSKICAAITSGFDSRTNLSRFLKIKKEALFYSWGMPGSLEIKVPQEISDKIGIPYRPVYLDEKFENNYGYYAKQPIFWSGGKATIRRANHNFSYEQLSEYSRENITGLIGSELIRPANAVGHIFTRDFIDVLFAEDKETELKKVFSKSIHRMFIREPFLQVNMDDLLHQSLEYFKQFSQYGERHIQLYMFTLNEGIRKYFGHEIHGNRMHSFINSPYIDDDFVNFLLRTPIPSLNIHAFKRNPASLKQGQLVYLPIMQSNYRQLMNIRTGRFYKPKDLLSPFYPLSVIPGMIRKKIHQSKANDTFNNKKWNRILFRQEQPTMNFTNEIFPSLTSLIEQKPGDLPENQQFNWDMHIAKHFSIRLWLRRYL